MTIEAEIRRTNAWVTRRIKPSRMPQDERPIADYEFQVPSVWLDNLATWAKMMLVVIPLAFALGYAVAFLWVVDHVGYFR